MAAISRTIESQRRKSSEPRNYHVAATATATEPEPQLHFREVSSPDVFTFSGSEDYHARERRDFGWESPAGEADKINRPNPSSVLQDGRIGSQQRKLH